MVRGRAYLDHVDEGAATFVVVRGGTLTLNDGGLPKASCGQAVSRSSRASLAGPVMLVRKMSLDQSRSYSALIIYLKNGDQCQTAERNRAGVQRICPPTAVVFLQKPAMYFLHISVLYSS